MPKRVNKIHNWLNTVAKTIRLEKQQLAQKAIRFFERCGTESSTFLNHRLHYTYFMSKYNSFILFKPIGVTIVVGENALSHLHSLNQNNHP